MHSKILNALVAIQQEVHLYKDAENPYFRSSYISLGQILGKLKPLLKKYNLFLSQTIHMDTVKGEYLELTIYFNDGEDEEQFNGGCYKIPTSEDSQKKGSAITYARRYQLLSALGLADVDDDGNGAVSSLDTDSDDDKTGSKKLPFQSKAEAIDWATYEIGCSLDEAKEIMQAVEPDENGKKGRHFHQKVMEMKEQQ